MYLIRLMLAIFCSSEWIVSDASMELGLIESLSSRRQVMALLGKMNRMVIMGIK